MHATYLNGGVVKLAYLSSPPLPPPSPFPFPFPPLFSSRKNNRPWQRRWVVFNGSELKYFQNKQDKDYACLNTVQLEKMIDVKRVPDVSFPSVIHD